MRNHFSYLVLTMIVGGCVGSRDATTASCGGRLEDAGSERLQVAQIHVTASTNASEIDVVIYDDASAERTLGSTKWGTGANAEPKSYPAHSPEIEKFLCDLAAVPDLATVGDHAEQIDRSSCPKSASFGTITTVTASGKTSGDLQCVPKPTAATSALAGDCDVISGREL